MLKKKLGLEAIEKRNWDFEFIYDYYKIPSTLIIPDDCKRIGKYVFSGCKNLIKVIIPKSVRRVGDAAFYGCENAEIILKKPESEFIKIGDIAFYNCKDVKEEIRD